MSVKKIDYIKNPVTWNDRELFWHEYQRFVKHAELEGISLSKALESETLPKCRYWENPCHQDWCKCTN